MTQYTIDINGKRYELSEQFRESLERRAELEYEENPVFSCWWKVDDDDPVLVIETEGIMVPWDRLDQLEATMPRQIDDAQIMDDADDEAEELDSGNGMKTLPPEDEQPRRTSKEIFGRTHFSLTPHRYEELPQPGGDDPDKIPPAPERVGDEPQMVVWVPRHPDVEHTWGAGEAIAPMASWVEWNVQKRADQPRPNKEKPNSHDSFESLCRIHDCEVIGEYTPSNDIPEGTSGSVERKGEEAFEEGRFGGDNWSR